MNRPTYFTAWWLASRPKTLTASFVPVMVGCALAWRVSGSLEPILASITLVMAFAIQVGINLTNDAVDGVTGLDTSNRIGPLRAVQQGWLSASECMFGGFCAFGCALVAALILSLQVGWFVFFIAFLCSLFGYFYSAGGRYSIASLGLSDPAVLLFFGLLATATTAYIQLLYLPEGIFVAGLQVGALATAMSALNNLRDVYQDAAGGRRTLPVRFGLCVARVEISILLLLPFTLGLYWLYKGAFFAGALPLLGVPIAALILKKVLTELPGPSYNSLLAATAGSLLLFGSLLTGGFVADSIVT